MQTLLGNLKSTIAEHGATIIEGANGPDAIRFANGAGIAFRWPSSTSDDAPELLIGARVAAAVAKTFGEIERINADVDHTPEWKAREVVKARERGAAAFAAAKADADRMTNAWDATEHAEAVPPTLAPTDYIGGLVDAEIREHVRSLSNAEHARLAQELLDGKQPRMLAALLRSPLSLPAAIAAVVAPAWLDAQAKADPVTARQRAHARALNESLRVITQQAAGTMHPRKPTLRVA